MTCIELIIDEVHIISMMILQVANFLVILHYLISVVCGQTMGSGDPLMIEIQGINSASKAGLCPSTAEREKALYGLRQKYADTSLISAAEALTAVYTCNGTTGWRRIVFINMTDTSYSCPSELVLTSYSKRTCGIQRTIGEGCTSTTFSVSGARYNQVCGRIRGYQCGHTILHSTATAFTIGALRVTM